MFTSICSHIYFVKSPITNHSIEQQTIGIQQRLPLKICKMILRIFALTALIKASCSNYFHKIKNIIIVNPNSLHFRYPLRQYFKCWACVEKTLVSATYWWLPAIWKSRSITLQRWSTSQEYRPQSTQGQGSRRRRKASWMCSVARGRAGLCSGMGILVILMSKLKKYIKKTRMNNISQALFFLRPFCIFW